MAIQDDELVALHSPGKEGVRISGPQSAITLYGRDSEPSLEMLDAEGNVIFRIDGANANIVGHGGGDLTFHDTDGNETIALDGSNGALRVTNQTNGSLVVQRGSDEARIGLGTAPGILVYDGAGTKRFNVSMDGTLSIFDDQNKRAEVQSNGTFRIFNAQGDMTFEVDSETGDIRTNGTIKPI